MKSRRAETGLFHWKSVRTGNFRKRCGLRKTRQSLVLFIQNSEECKDERQTATQAQHYCIGCYLSPASFTNMQHSWLEETARHETGLVGLHGGFGCIDRGCKAILCSSGTLRDPGGLGSREDAPGSPNTVLSSIEKFLENFSSGYNRISLTLCLQKRSAAGA